MSSSAHPAFGDIGACVFDAYGTLLDFNSAVDRCRDEIGGKADKLSELWRQKQIQYTWLRGMMGRHQDFWQVTGDALDFSMEAVGLDDPAVRRKLMAVYRTLDCFPEVPAVLRRLKEAGLKTAILSNGEPSMLEDAVRHNGLEDLLDEILSVESVGVFKPAPAVYQLAVDRLDVSRERISFQTSNAWDAAGAGHFGFKIAWCNRYGQPMERLGTMPEATISTLSELPAVLGLDA
ncbi:MAG: haloacid dehalogenase type II [Alphaproteobacteria bacterium]|nr:haloacid dehalogenase type II [Alphaproteobacteria bacterium]